MGVLNFLLWHLRFLLARLSFYVSRVHLASSPLSLIPSTYPPTTGSATWRRVLRKSQTDINACKSVMDINTCKSVMDHKYHRQKPPIHARGSRDRYACRILDNHNVPPLSSLHIARARAPYTHSRTLERVRVV